MLKFLWYILVSSLSICCCWQCLLRAGSSCSGNSRWRGQNPDHEPAKRQAGKVWTPWRMTCQQHMEAMGLTDFTGSEVLSW